MTGHKDETGKIQYEIGVYYVSKSNFGVGQIVGEFSDFSFLARKNFDAFIEKVKTLHLSQEEIDKLKSGPDSKAAQARIAKIEQNEQFVEDNSNTLLGILAVYKRIIEAKLLILRKLQTIESIGTFIKTDTGYKVTAPEGFVAIGHDGGAVKLVDRIEFSRENFAATKTWKKT